MPMRGRGLSLAGMTGPSLVGGGGAPRLSRNDLVPGVPSSGEIDGRREFTEAGAAIARASFARPTEAADSQQTKELAPFGRSKHAVSPFPSWTHVPAFRSS